MDSATLTDRQFRRLAAGLSHIIWRCALDGSAFVAPRWGEITGRTEAELQGRGWLETLHADDRASVVDAMRSARSCGAHFECEARLRQRDGSHHWYRFRGEPARRDDGKVVGWIGLAGNIDEQKRAERALVENEARLRLVMASARVGIVEHDHATGAVVRDAAAREILGISDQPFDFEQFAASVHPDDVAAFRRAARASRDPAGPGTAELEFRFVRPDGRVVWIASRGATLFEGCGAARRPTRFLGVISDVTQHMVDLMERARLSAIIASADAAIIANTLDGVVTHWNPAAERIFGWTAAEMLGQPVTRLMPIGEEPALEEHLAAMRRGDRIASYVAERLTRSGARITASITLSPIRDDAGAIFGVSAILRDISRERELEAELMQAQKMEAVGQLAGGVAHDLNNVLTAIMLALEIAEQSPLLDPETRDRFVEIRASSRQAARVVRELLTVARRRIINPRRCDLGEIIEGLRPVLARVVDESVSIAIDLGATREIVADPNQIGQVLLNLAINASDAMPGGGDLTIRTAAGVAADGRETVVLTVADTGVGMSPAVAARIFEPFFTTKSGAASGLGLSTAYAIVAQAGGAIAVASAEGKGATFTITLPAALPADGAEPPDASARHPDARSSGPDAAGASGNETLLIVEDERVVRDEIVRGLTALGYLVIEARNGTDALAVLERHQAPIHLVLSDVVMPDGSGPELAARLRAWYPTLRVLFMTGYSTRAVAAHGALMPGTELIEKPFTLAALAGRIRSILDRE